MFDRADKIRARSPCRLNEQIDHCIATRIEDLATRSDADRQAHLDRLDRAWSVDQAALVGLALVSMASTLAAWVRPRWLGLAAISTASLLQAATGGGGAVIAVLRRAGLRTRSEIECERYALKALRGDFDFVTTARSPVAQAGTALQAALR